MTHFHSVPFHCRKEVEGERQRERKRESKREREEGGRGWKGQGEKDNQSSDRTRPGEENKGEERIRG